MLLCKLLMHHDHGLVAKLTLKGRLVKQLLLDSACLQGMGMRLKHSIGRQCVGAFKHARVEKMPLNILVQQNAGTAWVSECVLETLACRGFASQPL